MLTRITVALLAIIAATGCPSNRTAQRTFQGSTVQPPPPMRAPAPPALAVIGDLRTPESVLHDPEQDVYFISNVNGALLTADDNGFISRVDARTMQVNLKWIESGKGGVHLDAPKGMAILGDTLYVSDIAGVRKFDRRTGAPAGLIALPGATLINDLTSDGTSLYVSDTAVIPGPGMTFYESGTDAIWKLTGDRAGKIASGASLRHPNGLDFYNGVLHVVTFGPSELYELRDGEKKSVSELPKGQLDGLIHLADGTPVVSSWQGEGVYRRYGRNEFVPILTGIDAPADIGYDARRGRLLVPRSGTNLVTIHALK